MGTPIEVQLRSKLRSNSGQGCSAEEGFVSPLAPFSQSEMGLEDGYLPHCDASCALNAYVYSL